MKEIYQAAVEYVMSFYNITYSDAVDLYKDEIQATMNLIEKGVIVCE